MKKIVIASIAALAMSTVAVAAVNGQACAACHGQNFEKPAMGKSKVVSEMTHADIEASLLGYKNTAGFGHSPMKGAMAGQVKRYSDEDLKAFSQTIGK
jgi:cytochrome c553